MTIKPNVPKRKLKPQPADVSSNDDDKALWRVMHSMFRDDHLHVVRPHIDSYNDVFQRRLPDLLRDCNPIVLCPSELHYCNLFVGGKTGNRVYYGKPVVFEGDKQGGTHILVPTEARMRNLTYSLTLHADIEVEFMDILSAAEMPTTVGVIDADRASLLARGGGPQPAVAAALSDTESEEEEEGRGEGEEKQEREKEKQADKKNGNQQKQQRREKEQGKEDPATWHVGTMEEALRHTVIESFDLNTRRQTRTYTIKNVYLGKIPIMLQSDYCLLRDVPPAMRVHLGECSDDPGGYFIIDGKERMFPLREISACNHVTVCRPGTEKEPSESIIAAIESIPDDMHPSRVPVRMCVRFVPPDTEYSNGQLVVDVPSWLSSPLPLFVLFRALGILSDKEIIDCCVLDQERFEHVVDLFLPSIHDAGEICTQFSAFRYISSCFIDPSTATVLQFLTNGILPHVGSINFRDKALHIGQMALRVILTHMGVFAIDDLSSLVHKRIQTPGDWLFTSIRTAYADQVAHIHSQFTRIMKQYRASYEDNLWALVVHNHASVFRKRVMETSIHSSFIDDTVIVDRRSFWSMLRQFRAVNTDYNSETANEKNEIENDDDDEDEITTTSTIHGTHWGYYCPLDHPSLTMSCAVSCVAVSVRDMVHWMRRIMNMKLISELSVLQLSSLTKMVVNGVWVGSIPDAPAMVAKMRLFRRNAMIPMHTSISFYAILNEVHVLTDRGRPTRPLFYADDITGEWSFKREKLRKELTSDTEGAFTWRQVTQGFHDYRVDLAGPNPSSVYAELSELYTVTAAAASQPTMMQRYLVDRKAIVDYVDANETATSLIALGQHHDILEKSFTHKEIHDSLTLGLMANTAVIHVEHNPATCTTRAIEYQSDAISHYHSTPEIRLEPDGVTRRVLHAGQLPAVQCRMSEWVSRDQHPWGINAIVAVMAWNGANASAVVINEAAIHRGLFHFTEYTTLDITADSLAGEHIDPGLADQTAMAAFTGQIVGGDYSHINKNTGIVAVGDVLFDGGIDASSSSAVIVAGITRNITDSSDTAFNYQQLDVSVAVTTPDIKKDTPPVIVDRVFRTSAANGENLIKLRSRQTTSIREGHTLASRDGRRAVVGAIVRETDMPFSAQGIRPDIIINPLSLSENMSVAQLMEMLIGKACILRGSQGDGSAFANWGNKVSVFSQMLPDVKLHSSGNEIMYDGFSGEQIEAEIFMGVSYFSMLPPVAGPTVVRHPLTADHSSSKKATDVRMEDVDFAALSAHGSMHALSDAWLDRADKYYFAVCNQTGMVAIYNPAKHLFMSPMVDGPVQFTENLSNSTTMEIRQVSKHGRSFSVICAPYAFKMLLQELLTANVALRLITDDSLPQLELAIKHSDETNKRLKLGQTFYNKLVSGETDMSGTNPSVNNGTEEERTRRQREQDLLAEAAAEEAAEQRRMLSVAAHAAAQRLASTKIMSAEPPVLTSLGDDIPIQFPSINNFDSTRIADGSLSPGENQPSLPMEGNINNNNVASIVEGDTVYDREDVQYPPSVWSVTNVGAHFITIQTSDPRNGDDNMKVVLPSRLYRTKDVPVVYTSASNENIYGGGGGGGINGGAVTPSLPPIASSFPPTLQFNPTINVVGHDNNAPIHNSDTVNQKPRESVNVTKQPGTSDGSLVTTGTTYIGEPDRDRNGNTKNASNSSGSGSSGSNNKSSEKDKGFVGGMIDFAKGFLIKKTG